MLDKLVRILWIALVVAAVCLCGAPAFAQATCTFDPPGVNTGIWDDADNWSCGRTPTEADNVVIPSGKTCLMDFMFNPGYARTVDVDGTLGILYSMLVLGESTDTDSTSTVDGTIYFQGIPGTYQAAILVARGGWVTLTGSGAIEATNASGRDDSKGTLACCASLGGDPEACAVVGRGFVVGSGVTLKGNLQVSTCMELNGTAKVDFETDLMTIGTANPLSCSTRCVGPKLFGTGKIKVSAGSLAVLVANLNQSTSPDWELSKPTSSDSSIVVGTPSGGQCTCDDTRVKISMTGGTLDFQSNFTTRHAFEASGGKIKKKAGKTVVLR